MYLTGIENYNEGIEILNNECSAYGEGEGAVEVRSINVDDINRITGYDSMITHGFGTIEEYGKGVYYKREGNKIKASIVISSVSEEYDLSNYNMGKFYKTDGTELQDGEQTYFGENSYYTYQAQNCTWLNGQFWLASSFISSKDGIVRYGLRTYYSTGYVGGEIDGVGQNGGELWRSDWGDRTGAHGVRAVVKLDSNITLTEDGANSWTLS